MGAGYNRMNSVTVQQTTQGLMHYLQQQGPQRLQQGGVAIGYDGRHHSREFALIAAAVFVSQGIPVWLFSELVPTPFVPAAVQQLVSEVCVGFMHGGACAAPHHSQHHLPCLPVCRAVQGESWSRLRTTPPNTTATRCSTYCRSSSGSSWRACCSPSQPTSTSQDHRLLHPLLQVYWSNACQIIPPHDAGIAAAIEQNLALWPLLPLDAIRAGHPLVRDPLDLVAEQYYSSLSQHLRFRSLKANAAAPPVAYTALHGVGTPWLQRAFREFGLPAPVLAARQCTPDPDFSTGV